jgi:hypothetical protein
MTRAELSRIRREAARLMVQAKWAKASEADRERLRTLRSKPTPCPKCGAEQPTARQARVHCRVPRQKKESL